jgi:hypothetical protein
LTRVSSTLFTPTSEGFRLSSGGGDKTPTSDCLEN